MWLVLIIVTVIFFIALRVSLSIIPGPENNQQRKEKGLYTYTAKPDIMTTSEKEFFHLLQDAVIEKYVVFPQVHLSSILDHHTPGQKPLHAFRHINQKSVDYVLCTKSSLTPVYAIELDDYTHTAYKHRFDRDIEVERILREAKIPLARFKNYKGISMEEIRYKLSEAKSEILY